MTIWKRWIQRSVLCGLLLGGIAACSMIEHPSVDQVAPGDHAALAAWYDKEAAQLRQSAKDEMAMAEMYRKNPGYTNPGVVSQRPDRLSNMIQHCESMAAMYTKAAEEAERLAQDHRDIMLK